MTWEAVAILGLFVVAGLVVWRESRRTRTTKLQKLVKLQGRQISRLETEFLGLPGAQTFAELEAKLKELEQKTGASPTAALKSLVDRVNTVSTDAMEMKQALVDITNRVKRMETGSTWRKATNQDGNHE